VKHTVKSKKDGNGIGTEKRRRNDSSEESRSQFYQHLMHFFVKLAV
jgi:hypothetical protein